MLIQKLKDNRLHFHPVVPFDSANEKIIGFDFTEKNFQLQKVNIDDTRKFCNYINDLLQNANAKFGFGGYDELRPLYTRSKIFNDNLLGNPAKEEPRRLHIGIDIWGNEGTEIFAPLNAIIHSLAFNDNFGDYGATIILKHELENISFFTLYGHLSLADIKNRNEGDKIHKGQQFAHFGNYKENGHWPPHLHFQVINDIGPYRGDYPGVCKLSEQKQYLANSPDPDLILNMQQFIR